MLRGGASGPNYDAESIARCEAEHLALGLRANIMVDCSHANSNKDPARQPLVAREVARQIRDGNRSLMGLMIESHLHAGQQPISSDRSAMAYGVSVTDACIDWKDTEALLKELAEDLKAPLRARQESRSEGGELAEAG